MEKSFSESYAAAGVDITAGYKAVELMKQLQIYKPYINDFKKDNLVTYFERHIGYWAFQDEELNNKINKELEQMAKTLYEYWFVQFDFPDEKGRPYKSANGKMVYNDILKREIPEGWEVVKLKDLVNINKIKSEPCSNKKLIDLSVMPSKTMCLNGFSNGDAFETNMFTMKKYDILFGSIRPYLLKAGFAPFDGLVSGTIHSVSPKETTNSNYLIMTMVSKSLSDYAIKSSKLPTLPFVEINTSDNTYVKEYNQFYDKILEGNAI